MTYCIKLGYQYSKKSLQDGKVEYHSCEFNMILISGKVRACFSPRWSQSAFYLCKCRGKLFRRWWRFTERRRLETETHPIYSSSSPTPIFFRSIYPSSSPTPKWFTISIFFSSSPPSPNPIFFKIKSTTTVFSTFSSTSSQFSEPLV